jgi:6-phosphogluconolactonase/glucosamine-6-phosphate isomerase/deaminase
MDGHLAGLDCGIHTVSAILQIGRQQAFCATPSGVPDTDEKRVSVGLFCLMTCILLVAMIFKADIPIRNSGFLPRNMLGD